MKPSLGRSPLVVASLLLLVAPGCKSTDAASVAPTCDEPAPAAVLDPATKRDDIRHLLELTGSAALAEQILAPLFDTFRRTIPGVPPEVWDRLQAKMDTNELMELVVDVYDEELSHEDIVAMVQFYESAAGQRITGALPTITAKSQDAGRRYGEQVAQQVIEELMAQGYSPQ